MSQTPPRARRLARWSPDEAAYVVHRAVRQRLATDGEATPSLVAALRSALVTGTSNLSAAEIIGLELEER